MKKLFFLSISLTYITLTLYAQCCSPGNPVGGTANLSIVEPFQLRTNTYYRFGYSNQYYNENKPSEFNFIDNASYSYIGNILTFGIVKKLNFEAELGYYFSKRQEYNLNPKYILESNGLNDGVFSLKYNFYKNAEKEWEFTLSSGVKIPFRQNPLIVDNVTLPIDIQPSMLSYGFVFQSFLYKGFIKNGWHLFLLNRFETYNENTINYKYGNAFYHSLFISKSLNNHFSILLQLRNEIKSKDKRFNQLVSSSGSFVFYSAPQLIYNIKNKWYLSFIYDFPFYKYYNGTHLTNKYSLSFNISRTFDLKN